MNRWEYEQSGILFLEAYSEEDWKRYGDNIAIEAYGRSEKKAAYAVPDRILWEYHQLSSNLQNNHIVSLQALHHQNQPYTANWMNDFSIFVNRKTPSIIGSILCILWCVGICFMLIKLINSIYHFHAVKKSALPLQNSAVRRLYQSCLAQMQLKKPIPIYSTAFLHSPVIAGFVKPCIYLPISLISNYNENDMKFMLLHELGHYKYKDALANYFMSLVGVLYWFHPLVWYALKEMKNDREVACDTTVLKQIGNSFESYNTKLPSYPSKILCKSKYEAFVSSK